MQAPRIVLDSRNTRTIPPPVEPVLCYHVSETDGARTLTPAPVFTPGTDEAKFADAQRPERITAGDLVRGCLTGLVDFLVLGLSAGCVVVMAPGGDSPAAAYGMLIALFGGAVTFGRILKEQLDKRPPVVLLRAHHDDALHVHKGLLDFERLGRRQLGDNATEVAFEEVLYSELQFYGPTFALSPEDSEKLGLDRGMHYRFSHGTCPLGEWQQVILYRIAAARMVVVILGTARSLSDKRWGLAWEIATLRAVNCPEKVVLVVPPCPDAELSERWTAFRQLAAEIGIRAPAALPADTRVLLFTEQWVCVPAVCSPATMSGFKTALGTAVDDRDLFRARIRRGWVGFALGFVTPLAIIFGGGWKVDPLQAVAGSLTLGFVLGGLFFAPQSVW